MESETVILQRIFNPNFLPQNQETPSPDPSLPNMNRLAALSQKASSGLFLLPGSKPDPLLEKLHAESARARVLLSQASDPINDQPS